VPETLARPTRHRSVCRADVIASLEAGDLKGKRIGSWRITRCAIEF
jgi:hypothetical protein